MGTSIIHLNEKEREILKSMDDKLDQVSITITKAKLIKKIINARQSILKKGWDIGGQLHDKYTRLDYDFESFCVYDLIELLQAIKNVGKSSP